MRSFTKVAGVAGMGAAVAAIGLGFGAGTAAANPVHDAVQHITANATSHPHPVRTFVNRVNARSHPVQNFVDGLIDSTYRRGEDSPIDRFSDLLTPRAD